MVKLYFVRHGKTEWNLENRFQGYTGDSPLLPEALEELKELGQYLSPITFDHIYASDLPRAYRTAQAIQEANPLNPAVETRQALREWNFGSLEGGKITLFKDAYPREYEALMTNPARFHAEIFGAESVFHVTKRLRDFVTSLKDQKAQHLLMVSHGTILTASIRSLLGYEGPELRSQGGLDNASITILETDDFEHFDLLSWNDTSYKSH